MKNLFDYLIVGQGLAGTILAYTLLKNGKKIFIVDDANLSSCSKVAAGNYNPIVFKRLVKSWMADEVIPCADNFYRETEKFLNEEFFWKKEIMKIFADEREKNFWQKKQKDVHKYLSTQQNYAEGEASYGIVKNAGKIYAAKFLGEFRKYFMKENILVEEKFDFEKLKNHNDFVEYSPSPNGEGLGVRAQKIIFCEGWKAMENPYFKYLPFKPAKGEIIVLQIENFSCDKIIHKNGYLYQIGENLFVAGGTYQWNELNDLPTENGKNIIVEKVNTIMQTMRMFANPANKNLSYKIIGHYAGVRPSTKDRRPFIGLHPEHKSIGIFNGFGTKAVMLAPYFANEFYEVLEKNKMLNVEVDITRFV